MKEANVLDLDGKDNSMIPTVSNGSLFFAPLLREPQDPRALSRRSDPELLGGFQVVTNAG